VYAPGRSRAARRDRRSNNTTAPRRGATDSPDRHRNPSAPRYLRRCPAPAGSFDELPQRFGPHICTRTEPGRTAVTDWCRDVFQRRSTGVRRVGPGGSARGRALGSARHRPDRPCRRPTDLFVDEHGLIWVTDRAPEASSVSSRCPIWPDLKWRSGFVSGDCGQRPVSRRGCRGSSATTMSAVTRLQAGHCRSSTTVVIYATHFWEPRLSILDVSDPAERASSARSRAPIMPATWQVQVADDLLVQAWSIVHRPGEVIRPQLRRRHPVLRRERSDRSWLLSEWRSGAHGVQPQPLHRWSLCACDSESARVRTATST